MTIDIAGDLKYTDTELYPMAWHGFKCSPRNGRNNHGHPDYDQCISRLPNKGIIMVNYHSILTHLLILLKCEIP